MGRGRGKGKRQSAIVEREDPLSGEEGKVTAFKRRGRPVKPLMDEIEGEVEEVTENMEKGEENMKDNVSSNDLKSQVITVNKRKRKRSVQVKEKKMDPEEENGNRAKSISNDSTKPAGFRHNGSRRKNKPHRAAEAGVDCK